MNWKIALQRTIILIVALCNLSVLHAAVIANSETVGWLATASPTNTLTASGIVSGVTNFVVSQSPTNGTLVQLAGFATNGQWQYTPNFTNMVDSDSFVFYAHDASGDMSPLATVSITVTNVPYASNAFIGWLPNKFTTNALVGLVSSGPTNFSIVQYPTNGEIVLQTGFSTNGLWTYHPFSTSFSGADAFLFSVTDNNGHVSPAGTVSIIVTNLPYAYSQAVAFLAGSSLTYTLQGLVSSGVTNFIVQSNPTNGILTQETGFLTNGLWKYASTNALTNSGPDRFTFYVKDSQSKTSLLATVSISVTPTNVPYAISQSVGWVQGTFPTNQLTGIVASGTTNFSIVQNPLYGKITQATGFATNGLWNYAPYATNFFGTDSFTFEVHGATTNLSQPGVISITVTNVPAAPFAHLQYLKTRPNQSLSIQLSGDDDGNDTHFPTNAYSYYVHTRDMRDWSPVFTVLTNPTNGVLSGTAPFLTYKPSKTNVFDTFTFKVNNGVLDSAPAMVMIKVADYNIGLDYFDTSFASNSANIYYTHDVPATNPGTVRPGFEGWVLNSTNGYFSTNGVTFDDLASGGGGDEIGTGRADDTGILITNFMDRLGRSRLFNFYGRTFTNFFFDQNGLLSFDTYVYNWVGQAFPAGYGAVVAPLWCDVNTLESGGTQPNIGGVTSYGLGHVTDTFGVNSASYGRPALIFTWNDVCTYPGDSDTFDRFQVVLIDRSDLKVGDFDVEFNYEFMDWLYGDASGGVDPVAGVDAGDDVHYDNLPGTETGAVVDYITSGNTTPTIPGRYLFRVNSDTFSPFVTNAAVASVGATNATFSALVDPNGPWTETWFAVTNQTLGTNVTNLTFYAATFPSGTTNTNSIAVSVTNLLAGCAYIVTAYASNEDGLATNSVVLDTPPELSTLSLSNETLLPTFSPGVAGYICQASNATTFSLTAIPTNAAAFVYYQINGGGYTGSATATTNAVFPSISLNFGVNELNVEVVSQAGATNIYTVAIVFTPSSDSSLTALSLSTGAIAPSFSSAILNYSVSVTNVSSLTATDVPTSLYATSQINGGTAVTSTNSVAVPLTVGPNSIPIVVTAQDTVTKTTYKVNVTLWATPSFNNLIANPSIPYGATSLTLTGILSGTGPAYPAQGDPITATINGRMVTGSVINAVGGFSITYNDPSLAVDPVAGSPYVITYAYAGNPNVYLTGATNTTTSLTVTKVPLGLTANNQSKTYGTTLTFPTSSTAFTASGLRNGETIGSVTLSDPNHGGAANALASGSYPLVPSAATGGTFSAANYNLTYTNGTLTVNQLPVILTGHRSYDGTAVAASTILSVSNIVGSDAVNVASGTSTLSSSTVGTNAITSLGTLTLGGGASANYTLTGASGAVIITQTALVITAQSQAVTYGMTVPATTVTYSGFIGQTNTALTTQPTIVSAKSGLLAAGTYTGNYTASGAVNTNYSITYVAGNLTVNATNLSITANSESKIYGTALTFPVSSAAFTPSGLQNGETIGSVTLSDPNHGGLANAAVGGNYPLVPSAATGGTFSAANYNITYDNGSLTVSQLPVILTGHRSYDGTAIAASTILSVSNIVGSDAVNVASGSCTLSSSTVGTNAISSLGTLTLGGGASANYTLTGASGAVVITQTALVITAQSQAINYGMVVPATTVTYSGFVAGQTNTVLTTQPTIVSTKSGLVAVGAYTGNYTASGAVNTNYSITYVAGNLTVSATNLSITANPESKIYGTALTFPVSSAAFTPSGLQNGETIGTVTLSDPNHGGAANAAAGGNYPLVPSAATGGTFSAANYNITYDNGSLTVSQLPVILTGHRSYDGTATAASTILSVSNIVGSDAVNVASGSCTLSSSTVGTNAITSLGTLTLGGGASANYTLTGASGAVIITQTALVIAAQSQTVTYGTTVPATTVTYSGFVQGQTNTALTTQPTILSAKSGVVAVGTYTGNYTASGAVNTNYTISYVAGNLTVSAANLSITANPESKIYGVALALPASSTSFTPSGLQNNETIGSVTLSDPNHGGAANAAAGGSYPLVPSAATGGTFSAANYNITYDNGSLTVSQLPVILTGRRSYDGTATAASTILSVSNIVGSDVVNVASGSCTLTSSNIGTNAITFSGTLVLGGAAAGNYTTNGMSGAVVITSLPVTLTGTRPYDGTAIAQAAILTIATNYDGANLTLSGTAPLAGASVGLQNITDFSTLALGGTAATNYTLISASGSVTITLAVPTVICPANISDTMAAGQCGNKESFAATTNNTGGPTTLIYSIPGPTTITSPWFFPVGTTVVTSTVTNAAGTNSCTFTVTITDPTPPVAGAFAIGPQEGTAESVPVAKILQVDQSQSGGPLSIASVTSPTTNNAVVTLANALLTYTPAANYVGTDTINYVLSDGCGTAPGAIAVTVTSSNAPSQNGLSIQMSGANAILQFHGIPGQAYYIQVAPTASGPWTDLPGTPVTANPLGLIAYTVTAASSPSFYRTSTKP